MSKFATRLNRASARLLNTAHQHIPVPFEIHCSCGNRLSGLRRNTSQLSSCSSCERTFYVLPVNCYPTTHRVPSQVSDKSLAGRSAAAMRELLGMSTAEPVTPIVLRPARKTRKPKTAANPADPESTAAESSQPTEQTTNVRPNPTAAARQQSEPEELRRPHISLNQHLRRVFSPVRVIAFSTVLLLSLTAWWMIHERQHEAAIRNWRTCLDEVLIALDEQDPVRLREFLPQAVAAADILERNGEEAALVRSLHQQTMALEQISSSDLIDQLESLANEDPAVVQQKSALLRDQWFVFQTPLAAGSDSTTVVIRLPLLFGTEPAGISVRSDLLRAYLQQAETPAALFAAPISSVQINPGPPAHAVLELDGEQLVLLTLDFLVADAGFDPEMDSELRLLFQQQATFLGVSTSSLRDESATTAPSETDTDGGAAQ